jgi:hypothetical protein
MNKNTKILIASVIILAFSTGFFGGAWLTNFSAPPYSAKMHRGYPHESKIESPHAYGPRFHASDRYQRNSHMNSKRTNKSRERNTHRRHNKLTSTLNFTEEQLKNYDTHFLSSDSIHHSLFEKIRNTEIKLQNELAKKPIDSTKLQHLKSELLTLNESRLTQRISDMRFFNELLTQEQHQQFESYRKKRGAPFYKKNPRPQ